MDNKVLFEIGNFWVTCTARGDYEVYENGVCAARKRDTFGKGFPQAFERAKAAATKRAESVAA